MKFNVILDLWNCHFPFQKCTLKVSKLKYLYPPPFLILFILLNFFTYWRLKIRLLYGENLTLIAYLSNSKYEIWVKLNFYIRNFKKNVWNRNSQMLFESKNWREMFVLKLSVIQNIHKFWKNSYLLF